MIKFEQIVVNRDGPERMNTLMAREMGVCDRITFLGKQIRSKRFIGL
jgi:hypothetical protein